MSIVNGQNQSLSVEARSKGQPISGANCKLTNNKGAWFVTSPGSASVHRSFEDLSVRCEKDNPEPGLVAAKSSTKGMAFGNILFGSVIGAGVDMASGAAYDYHGLISVEMGEIFTLAPPQQAAADTNATVPVAGSAMTTN